MARKYFALLLKIKNNPRFIPSKMRVFEHLSASPFEETVWEGGEDLLYLKW